MLGPRIPTWVLAALLTAATAARGQVPVEARRTVVVAPFEVEGYAPDRAAIRRSAAALTDALQHALAADSTVVWLPHDVRARPRNPATGLPPAAHHLVTGWISQVGPGAVAARWRVVVIEDQRPLVADSLPLGVGYESEAAGLVARRVAAAIRAAWPDEPGSRFTGYPGRSLSEPPVP